MLASNEAYCMAYLICIPRLNKPDRQRLPIRDYGFSIRVENDLEGEGGDNPERLRIPANVIERKSSRENISC